jgi:alpha-beta hydrolase superfamily lysophospholipase
MAGSLERLMISNLVRQGSAVSAAAFTLLSLCSVPRALAQSDSTGSDRTKLSSLSPTGAPVTAVQTNMAAFGTSVNLPSKAALISWIDPKVNAWAAVLCIHGLGFHKETYSQLAKRLCRLGIAVYAIDVRGFGVYKENNSHARVDYEKSFHDIEESLISIKQSNPKIPVFVLGESMGGAMALQAAARYPELINGAASSVPAFNTIKNLPLALKATMIGLLRGPNGQVSIAGDVVARSTDKKGVQEDLLNNPATRQHMAVRDLVAYRKLMAGNDKAIKHLAGTPVLLVQGFKDKLIGPHATTKMFGHIATADKDLILVGKSEHLVFEEGQFSDETIDSLVSWLNKHSHSPFALLPSQLSKMDTPVQTFVGAKPEAVETPTPTRAQTKEEVLDSALNTRSDASNNQQNSGN